MAGLIIFAAALGSFTAAWYKRLLVEESITKGRSRCDSCGKEILKRDLIPILSWLWLRGKCRHCSSNIGVDVLVIELLTVIVVVITIINENLTYDLWSAVRLGVIAMLLVCLMVIGSFDYKTKLIPMIPVYILGAAVLGLYILNLLASGFDTGLLTEKVLGATVFSGIFFAIYLLSDKRWVGLGDVFLLIPLGFWLGWFGLFMAIFFGSSVASIVVLIGLATKKLQRHQMVPFGPVLILGAFLSLWFGDSVQLIYFGEIIF